MKENLIVKLVCYSPWGNKADKHSQEVASGTDSGRDIAGCCSSMLYCAMFFITEAGELLAIRGSIQVIYLQGG